MMNNYHAIKVGSADHCDFENPTDSVCELSCENESTLFEDSEIRSAIITFGTAAVLSLADISEHGLTLWSDESIEDWSVDGIIQKLE